MKSNACRRILAELRAHRNEANRAGMARFGIKVDRALGISTPLLRAIARREGRDHELALALWDSRVHEARVLAAFVDDPGRLTSRQMDAWAAGFDSWDVCDQACNHLFRRSPLAHAKVRRWARSGREFVRRAGFALLACLAVHDKEADNAVFEAYLPLIQRHATDERNFVKKAVNWALRQIGKRNERLRRAAMDCARRIAGMDSRCARWIAADALRELEGRGRVGERRAGQAGASAPQRRSSSHRSRRSRSTRAVALAGAR